MEHFEQLLTCCVCLDRYRNPKLLPCQHSFCMDPCMEGLVDHVRRQVKCPECRAEHRIPYQGVQAFPTNVTLQRFLELRMEITGEPPDPTSGLIPERCNVCSEKSYLSHCAHCDKKICEDCKSAHMDILRREITRINSQIRRGINRLQDALCIVEKNSLSLQTNCCSVSGEVEEVYQRMSKALKDRAEHLRGDIDRYLSTEVRNLTALKSNLDVEVSNIQSNCDIADKFMNDNVDWDDCELMDTKEIFLKTVEFIRSFEYENADYSRRVRFFMEKTPNELVTIAATFGELHMQPHSAGSAGGGSSSAGGGISAGGSGGSNSLHAPSGPGLMRSKSDHRLASQFRQQQEERGMRDGDDESSLGGRKFGERNAGRNASGTSGDRYSGGDRYGRGTAGDYGESYGNDYDNESSGRTKSRFRSRFVRSHQTDDNSDCEQGRNVRFNDKDKERDRVLDTEDVTRGHLSGIIRLADSPRVMKRLQESEKGKKEKKTTAAAPATTVATALTVTKRTTAASTPAVATRQMSEDEIDRIKRQNKGASSSSSSMPAAVPAASAGSAAGAMGGPAAGDSDRPASDRVAALKSRASAASSASTPSSDESDHSAPSSPVRRTTPAVESKSSTTVPKSARSASTDSSTSESSASSSNSAARSTGTPFEHKPKSADKPSTAGASSSSTSATPAVRSRAAVAEAAAAAAAAATTTTNGTTEKKPFQSRFLPSHQAAAAATAAAAAAAAAAAKKDETDSSSEEETSSEESDEEDDDEVATKSKTNGTSATATSARDTVSTSAAGYSSPTYAGRSGYERETSPPKYGRNRTTTTSGRSDYEEPRYGTSGYQSRFLNKSKSSAVVATPTTSHHYHQPTDDDANNNTGDDSDSKYGTGRSRYLALKERRSRLARSRSSHNFGLDGDADDLDEPVSPTTASPSAYIASRYGTSSSALSGSDLARSRSSHALKSRESSPIRGVSERHGASSSSASAGSGSATTGTAGDTDKDGQALSSWARYLKNKYGNRSAKDAREPSATSSAALHATGTSSSPSATARRLSLGLPLRQANEMASSDDSDSKNGLGSPTSPTAAAVGITGAAAGTSPRAQYLQKRRQLFQLGGRGSEPGCFTWPRGIAVGPDNSIVVADSSNHRVQVFDVNGIFVKEFGQYGAGEAEFDCLAGVAVNRIGQYIIADRYNHRIQVLDPAGRFLRAFGSQGTADGKFNYPWGVTTDALGFIYVCDKENHRVQVFQSDGSFVGKFGTFGKAEGQLEHPHYIAVSNTNRVIVSDSNNHRIQIFDVNGRVLSTFGMEGSEEGQFKFPRGVAVDDQGFICVADSGNNRIQIFHPDGSFLRAFGSWGSGDAEFKGLEGVAVMSNGNILVCDRENHRVQVF